MKRFIVLILLAVAITGCSQDITDTQNQTPTNLTDAFQGVDVEEFVADWIRSSPTYAYDGENLTLEEHVILESYPPQHILTYTFTSTHAGYGDRSDQIVAQVLTNHRVEIRAMDGAIRRAVMDESWDMIEQEPIQDETSNQTGETVQMTFQPMQCETYAWDDWYAQGNTQYVQEPTDVQLITDYYADRGIEVDVDKEDSGMMTCQACSTCQTSYYYQARVASADQQALEADGWS